MAGHDEVRDVRARHRSLLLLLALFAAAALAVGAAVLVSGEFSGRIPKKPAIHLRTPTPAPSMTASAIPSAEPPTPSSSTEPPSSPVESVATKEPAPADTDLRGIDEILESPESTVNRNPMSFNPDFAPGR